MNCINLRLFKRKPVVGFIVGGTQKGGTTALDRYLRSHEDIAMATVKEVHFFDKELSGKERLVYSDYHDFFEGNARGKLTGEATPIYMYWDEAPRRIWEYNPEMKLIFVLRNPVERAYSHWNMERDRGAEKLSFWDAIINENDRCREALPFQHRVYSYVDRGFYHAQLKRIWTLFPRDQTLVIKNEDLRNNHNKTLDEVANFLSIKPFAGIASENVHSRPYVSEMSRREREYLNNIFSADIARLENDLGWDCTDWK